LSNLMLGTGFLKQNRMQSPTPSSRAYGQLPS
jgi:hypothetical protein